jgi:ABC-type sugar transport system ATPase subunit
MVAPAPLFELVDVSKAYPGVLANDRVSLQLNAGEIHGLLGENGCGKSTLIKILSGVHQPTSGRILREGDPVAFGSPEAARAAGVATVFQEFSLVRTLSVAENVFLGRLPRRGVQVDWTAIRDGARRVLAQMNVAIDHDAKLGDLSIAEQQLVEIAKALATHAKLLILDEPTTALGLDEIARLHGLLRRLREQGTAILYISHRLDEVVELVDVVTIMKDGRVVSDAGTSEISVPAIVRAMVGDVGDHYPKQRNAAEEIALSVRDLRSANRVNGVTFEVRRGEVFGVGGVLGSGRTELARALFGVDPVTGGEVRWKGRAVRFRSPADAIAAGFALVPENRKSDGLFFNFTGFPNMSIARLDRLGSLFRMDLGRERDAGRGLVRDLEITPACEDKEVGALSGGNQQKIVIARWLFAGAELFILDEPTQGIDVGAKVAVYRLINAITAKGGSVILISSDHDELLSMADRVGILRHGRMVEIREPHALDKADLVTASTLATEEAA